MSEFVSTDILHLETLCMAENNDRINQLIDKLETLLKRQESFSEEVNELREEINRLKIPGIKQATE